MTPARRLVVAMAASVATLLLSASPASAEPKVNWTNPTIEKPTITADGPLTGTITPAGEEQVEDVRVELIAEPPTDSPEDPCLVVPEHETVVADDKLSFTTDVVFPRNCKYRLAVTVEYCSNIADCTVLRPDPATPELPFSVAIPPAPVGGLEAAYNADGKKVDLTWAAQDDPDFLRYDIERNPPGPEGFVPLGTATNNTYTDTLPTDEEHRYQVVAVFRGPEPGSELRGEASDPVTAGPDSPALTVPDAPAPNQPRDSGGGGSRTNGGGGGTARPRTLTTVDDGFGQNLPFDPSATTTMPPTQVPRGDAAVVAQFDDDSDESDRRGVLIPVAGGLALIVGAAHMALLSKRASEPDIPILTR